MFTKELNTAAEITGYGNLSHGLLHRKHDRR